MHDHGLDEAHVQRCRNVWWTIYILDRQMSSLLGVPLAIRDGDISASLPTFTGSPQKSLALEVHVKLSGMISQILDSKSSFSYVLNTTDLLTSRLRCRGPPEQEVYDQY